MRQSSHIPWLRVAKEILRCNIAKVYPDILDEVSITPLYANFWVTTRCSGRCKTCTQWQQEAHEELGTQELKETIYNLKKEGVFIIYFVGGDIFLRKDIFELIRFATELGLRVHLTVNAYTLTEEIAKALQVSGTSSIHLSIDSLDHDFDDIRGIEGAAKKVLNSLKLLHKHRDHGMSLGLSATIMKDTIPSVKEVVCFAIQNSYTMFFNLINFTHDFFATDFSREQYNLEPQEKKELQDLVHWLKQKHMEYPMLIPRLDHLEWIGKYFSGYQQKGTPCFQTLLKVCVKANGDVRPCCSMETTGNLRKQTLKDIVRTEQYRGLLKKAIKKDCPGCSCRYTLNLDASMASWFRELLHRFGMKAWDRTTY
jgi:MoaA/NifB/PqqE/SkfB family radical SAM enzyme